MYSNPAVGRYFEDDDGKGPVVVRVNSIKAQRGNCRDFGCSYRLLNSRQWARDRILIETPTDH
jgi:hypothetical protein